MATYESQPSRIVNRTAVKSSPQFTALDKICRKKCSQGFWKQHFVSFGKPGQCHGVSCHIISTPSQLILPKVVKRRMASFNEASNSPYDKPALLIFIT